MSGLSAEQLDQFVEEGYTILRGAFSPATAAGIRALVWERVGLSPEQPEGWTQPLVHLCETVGGPVVEQAFTPRLHDAFDQVMGVGRWHPVSALGWWPVSFPGFDAPPWQPPRTGWHVDGIQFHHRLTSPDQGLLPIFMLSDIDPGGGGTALSVGSHRVCARVLGAAEPDGLEVGTLSARVTEAPRDRVVEFTGTAGDVALIHPFVLHARSPNTGSRVRFICNPCYRLREPMCLTRTLDRDHSLVEQAIRQALR